MAIPLCRLPLPMGLYSYKSYGKRGSSGLNFSRPTIGFTRPAGLQCATRYKAPNNNDATSEFEPRLAGSGGRVGAAVTRPPPTDPDVRYSRSRFLGILSALVAYLQSG